MRIGPASCPRSELLLCGYGKHSREMPVTRRRSRLDQALSSTAQPRLARAFTRLHGVALGQTAQRGPRIGRHTLLADGVRFVMASLRCSSVGSNSEPAQPLGQARRPKRPHEAQECSLARCRWEHRGCGARRLGRSAAVSFSRLGRRRLARASSALPICGCIHPATLLMAHAAACRGVARMRLRRSGAAARQPSSVAALSAQFPALRRPGPSGCKAAWRDSAQAAVSARLRRGVCPCAVPRRGAAGRECLGAASFDGARGGAALCRHHEQAEGSRRACARLPLCRTRAPEALK
jgi:hypothetical protein